jgi:hypothetical protein
MGPSLDESACRVSTACPHLTGGPQVDRARKHQVKVSIADGAGAITRTLPIDRFCFFERRTIDGQRYVDPGRHVQLAEDVTDV